MLKLIYARGGTPLVKEPILFPFLHQKLLNLAERRKKRCVKIEKKIGAAGSFCMDQSFFRCLFRLARKSKQSGLSKSEKSFAKRKATFIAEVSRARAAEHHG